MTQGKVHAIATSYHKAQKFCAILYEAPFKTKCHQCFRNLYRTSNIYIGCPISISDVRYLYPTSGYLYPTSGYLYPTSEYLYPTSDIQYPTSARAKARARARARAGISDVGYRYWMSDIYIGRPIYILDVRYRFRKHWWHFVINGAS